MSLSNVNLAIRRKNNIAPFVYSDIFSYLRTYYNSRFVDTNQLALLEFDSTYNRDKNYQEMLNMGIFDITISIYHFLFNNRNDTNLIVLILIHNET